MFASGIISFKSVDKGILISFFVYNSSSTIASTLTLPVNLIIISIIYETRRLEIKIHAVECHELRKHLGFGHFVNIIRGITVYKAASLALMSMKINVHLKSSFIVMFNYILFS